MPFKVRIEVSSVASKHRSGVAQYTRLLSEAFSSNEGFDVYGHYFNFLDRQPKPDINPLPAHIETNKLIPLKVYAKAQSFNFAPAFDFFLPKVDLTIFPNFATWPSVKSKHSATVIHDLTYLYYPEVVEEKNLAHLRRVVPRSIKKADFIITVSESVKSELIKEFKLNAEKCIVTPIPPDETFFKQATSQKIEAVKNKYGIKPEKKYVYFIGNLEPRKNLKTLIEAYALLPQETKNEYSLVLAGGKGWKTEATEKALQAAIAAGNDIKHLGFIDQVDSPVLYQGASLFVMPSLYEGFGMPILEAMAGGCNVVASDIPVLKEVGKNYASYADPLNPRSFADAIQQSLEGTGVAKQELQKHAQSYTWRENVLLIQVTAKNLSSL